MPLARPADLIAVTERSEARRAYRLLQSQLERGAKRIERTVGFQGGSAVENLLWRPTDGFWGLLDEGSELGRYWCAYGVETEPPSGSHSIVCEINPPHEGINRRCAGIFLKDGDGKFYLAHTGKVGGGRKGVGRAAFLRDYVGHPEDFRWPDGWADQVVVIGRIGASLFPGQLGRFVHAVREFKAAATRKRSVAAAPDAAQRFYFTPEFSGPRAPYEALSPVEARCNHGLVIDALKAALEREGLQDMIANDRQRDLFVATLRGSRVVLFEVKTDVSTSSLYAGIGQLMLHGAKERETPLRVLVLPEAPVSETRKALGRLEISVLTFDWVESRPVFARRDLRRVLMKV